MSANLLLLFYEATSSQPFPPEEIITEDEEYVITEDDLNVITEGTEE